MIIKILDRYILTRFLTALGVVSVAVTILVIAINMIEELRDFVDHDVPLKDIARYYLYFSGWALKSFLPVFVFLAGLFTVGVMARNNELRAIIAGGISLYRFSAPLIIAAIVISAGHFYYNEFIFPPANKKRVELQKFTIEKRSKSSVINRYNLYRQVSDSVYYVIDKYVVPERAGQGIKLYRRGANRLEEFIIAKKMRYNRGQWTLYDGSIHQFDTSLEISVTPFDSIPALMIEDKPADFERHLGKPEDMGYRELEEYIALMRRIGAPYTKELVDLKFKLAFPMTSIVVMILCVPLASNPRRGGIAVSMSSAAGFILVYLVSFKVAKALGGNENISPEIAAWSVNGFFLLVGIAMNYFTRK